MNIRSRSPKTGVQKRCLPNQAYKRYNTANFFLYNTFENQKKRTEKFNTIFTFK